MYCVGPKEGVCIYCSERVCVCSVQCRGGERPGVSGQGLEREEENVLSGRERGYVYKKSKGEEGDCPLSVLGLFSGQQQHLVEERSSRRRRRWVSSPSPRFSLPPT